MFIYVNISVYTCMGMCLLIILSLQDSLLLLFPSCFLILILPSSILCHLLYLFSSPLFTISFIFSLVFLLSDICFIIFLYTHWPFFPSSLSNFREWAACDLTSTLHSFFLCLLTLLVVHLNWLWQQSFQRQSHFIQRQWIVWRVGKQCYCSPIFFEGDVLFIINFPVLG